MPEISQGGRLGFVTALDNRVVVVEEVTPRAFLLYSRQLGSQRSQSDASCMQGDRWSVYWRVATGTLFTF